MRLKLDEKSGSRWLRQLRESSHDVDSVREEGLSGASDVDVLAAAVRERRALVTLDLDFANPLRSPPSETAGIAVLRVREAPGRDDLDIAVSRLTLALATAHLNGQPWIGARPRPAVRSAD